MNDWRAEAACKGEPTNLFFPGLGGWEVEDSKAAKAICRVCPVRQECRDYATRHEMFGIWGGTSERQRKADRRSAGIRMNVGVENGECECGCGFPTKPARRWRPGHSSRVPL